MRIALVVVINIFLFLPSILSSEEKATAQLAGLRIVGRGYGLNGTELRAFNQKAGTSLALIVQTPGNKKIVNVDDSRCSLIEFTDDRGYNLLDGVDWDSFPEISKDGHLALIKMTTKKRPSPKSTKFFAKGTIDLCVASSEHTQVIDALKLKVGTKTTIQQEVIQVVKAQAEDETLSITLQISKKFKDKLKDIRFYTTNGILINAWGRGSFTFGNAAQMEYNLDSKSTPEVVMVEIDLWQELETLNLPFEIESTIGF